MKRIFTIILLTFTFITSTVLLNAQDVKLIGKIVEKDKQSPLTGVYVILINLKDTTIKQVAATDIAGNFTLTGLKMRTPYRLRATYVGFSQLEQFVQFTKKVENIGTLYLKEKVQSINEVVIKGQAPPAIQKGDTTELNASAFKVNPDANAQDLVQKMPGVTIENGTVKAHGENVQRILVDGKNYFGEDPAMALQNLPAEVVDKVQIYNKLSDQAEFTGFDDGNSAKVMNIITRTDRRNGTNGIFTAGTDFSDKYAVNGRLNLSKDQHRLALTAGSNNVNQQNFNMQDLIGAFGGRGGGGRGGSGGGFGGRGSIGTFVGRQGGINTTNSFGLNYTDMLGKKVTLTGSYFFNKQHNVTDQSTFTSNFNLDTTSHQSLGNLLSDQNSHSNNTNFNHRFDLRLEYAIDSANTIIWSPRFTTQQNDRNSSSTSDSYYNLEKIESSSDQKSGTDGLGYTYSSDLLFRHKFHKKGRTISLGITVSGNLQNSDGTNWSLSAGRTGRQVSQNPSDTTLLDQKSDSKTKGTTISSNLAYTEPIGKNGIIQLGYNVSITENNTDKYSYNQLLNPPALDTVYSNVYKNNYNTQRGGITYRVRGGDKLMAAFGVDYQIADLTGDRTFPQASNVDRQFENILPNVQLNYKFSQKANLRVFYRTSTNPPSINQLQNVLTVNSPSLSYSEGNPDLKHEYSNNGVINYRFSNPAKSTNFSINLFGGYTINAIGNAVYNNYSSKRIAITDIPIALPNTISKDSLNLTGQFTKPVNFTDSWNMRTFINYGFLFTPLKCNFNLIGGGGYTTSPGSINGIFNITNQYNVTGGMVIGSNISQNADFTLSYTGNYTVSTVTYKGNMTEQLNTLSSNSNSYVWNHSVSLRSNFIWKGFVLQNTLSEQINRGLTGGNNKDYMIWNVALGKKFLKNNSGEVKLTVFDMLNQNQNITHTVSASSISDSRTNTLQRYFLLSFTYNLRNYKAASDDHRDHGPGFGPPGMRPF